MMGKQFEVADNGRQPQFRQKLAWRLLSTKTVSVSLESASFFASVASGKPLVTHL